MIAVLTPYGRNETTLAALRVADFARARGSAVRVVATTVPERGVHAHWDRFVRSPRGDGLCRGALHASVCVHFECSARFLEAARLVAAKARHILVANGHHVRASNYKQVIDYDSIVCPAKSEHQHLEEVLPPQAAVRLTHVLWDAGVPILHRTVGAEVPRLYLHCDYAAIDYCGPMLLQLVDMLLQEIGRCEILLAHAKSWPRRERRHMHALVRDWPGRFTAVPSGDLATRARHLAESAWALVPAARAGFGFMATLAQACGTPVIAHDVPPFGEFIHSGINGFLVPCEIRSEGGLLPLAIPSLTDWLSTCRKALLMPPELKANLHVQDWGLATRRKKFEDAWARLLNL